MKISYSKILEDLILIIYTIIILPLVIFNLYWNPYNLNYNFYINIFSTIFLIITGLKYLYQENIPYFTHNICCLSLLFLNCINNNSELNLLINYSYFAEISTFFLSTKRIIKVIDEENKLKVKKKIYNYLDTIFGISYFLIRICFLIPYSLVFIKKNTNLNLYLIVKLIIYFKIMLNTHWLFFIINMFITKKDNIEKIDDEKQNSKKQNSKKQKKL